MQQKKKVLKAERSGAYAQGLERGHVGLLYLQRGCLVRGAHRQFSRLLGGLALFELTDSRFPYWVRWWPSEGLSQEPTLGLALTSPDVIGQRAVATDVGSRVLVIVALCSIPVTIRLRW